MADATASPFAGRISPEPTVRVSIVIPAYNAAPFIRSALQSVLAQTVADLELIVVDDASTDDTAAVVRQLAASDRRIRLVENSENLGPGASRNRGFDLARGEWIALLDADDQFLPDRIEKLLALGEQHNSEMVSDNLWLCAESGGSRRRLIEPDVLASPRPISFQEFIEGCIFDIRTEQRSTYVFMHPIFRRSFLKLHGIRYDDRCRNGEDFLIYVDCLAAGARWIVCPEPLYIYAMRAGSLTDMIRDEDRELMIGKLRALLQSNAARSDTGLNSALRRYLQVVLRYYVYDRFKNSLRGGNLRMAGRIISADFATLRLICNELIRRSPLICRTIFRRVRMRVRSAP